MVLFGASYTFLSTNETGQSYFGYSNELHTQKFHSIGIDAMYFTRKVIGVHLQVRYMQAEWSHYRFRDARIPFSVNSYPYWTGSESRHTDDIMAISSLLTFSSEGERVKFVAELGGEMMVVTKQRTMYYESSVDTAGTGSPYAVTEETTGPAAKFVRVSPHLAARVGVTGQLYKSLYLSVFVHGRVIVISNFLPSEGGFVTGAGVGIFYSL